MKAIKEILAERERHSKEIERLNREIDEFKERGIRRKEEIEKLTILVEEYDQIIYVINEWSGETND